MHKSQQQTVEIIQRPNRAGIEPVNELSFELERDGQAYGYTKQNSKGTRAHTHTHTHSQDSSQLRLPLVPLSDLSELHILGQHKPDRGEDSAPEPSSCGPCGSSGEADGVPLVGQDGISATSYRIGVLA